MKANSEQLPEGIKEIRKEEGFGSARHDCPLAEPDHPHSKNIDPFSYKNSRLLRTQQVAQEFTQGVQQLSQDIHF